MRVQTETLDRFLSTVGEVILTTSQVRTAVEAEGRGLQSAVSVGLSRMDRVVGELQRRALDLRTIPLARITDPLPRVAREIAQRTGKRVEVEIHGGELELDRSILDRIADPLNHLVRNSVDHGVETVERREAAGKPGTGRVTIDARREREEIRISVTDDGAGIDLDAVRARAVEAGLLVADLAEDLPSDEIASLVFRPGISTAQSVSEISGRGVGMDAVRATIESLGGHVELRTQRGRGTEATLVVPITAAVQRVLLVGLGRETVAIPVAKVERIEEVPAASVERSGREAFALVDDEPVPVLDLAEWIAISPGEPGPEVTLVLGEVRGSRVALRVDRIVGQQQIYVKSVPPILSGLRALLGLTILGDGRPVFLLDTSQLP